MNMMALPSEPRDPSPAGEVTRLLAAARDGDGSAFDRLFSLVYHELKRLAHGQRGDVRGGLTLATTALVNEAYIKLARPDGMALADREHFFAVAARAMRQILIDRLRRQAAAKRGGGAYAVELEDQLASVDPRHDDLLALDEALQRLTAVSTRLAELVELRFFAGQTLEEIAAMRGVSDRTLKRDWRKARAFLYRELGGRASLVLEEDNAGAD